VLRYAGYCFDEHSGMYYLSQRYYDPATCQFITKDPAKADGEESAYQYCGGDPVGKVDPSGYLAVPSWMKSAYSMAGRLVRAYLGINSQERAAIKRNPTAGIVYVYWCYRALASERMFFGTMGHRTTRRTHSDTYSSRRTSIGGSGGVWRECFRPPMRETDPIQVPPPLGRWTT